MPSAIAWPEWMPAPQQDSFSIQPEDRRLTSETESGAIIRYQFDSDVNVAECTLILSRVQALWFESFERGLLRQGTVWFEFPLWVGGEIVREKCRFKTRPKAGNLIGLHTTYTFSLYVSNRSSLLSAETVLALSEYGLEWLESEEVAELATLLHHAVHFDMSLCLEFLP